MPLSSEQTKFLNHTHPKLLNSSVHICKHTYAHLHKTYCFHRWGGINNIQI